jgi:hypothetical protein
MRERFTFLLMRRTYSIGGRDHRDRPKDEADEQRYRKRCGWRPAEPCSGRPARVGAAHQSLPGAMIKAASGSCEIVRNPSLKSDRDRRRLTALQGEVAVADQTAHLAVADSR